LPPESPLGDPSSRHARELIRIARVSLFRWREGERPNHEPAAAVPAPRGEEQQEAGRR
jgi:hypothetical protein